MRATTAGGFRYPVPSPRRGQASLPLHQGEANPLCLFPLEHLLPLPKQTLCALHYRESVCIPPICLDVLFCEFITRLFVLWMGAIPLIAVSQTHPKIPLILRHIGQFRPVVGGNTEFIKCVTQNGNASALSTLSTYCLLTGRSALLLMLPLPPSHVM